MTLDGAVVMTIGSSSFPDELKVRNARSNQLALLLTSVDRGRERRPLRGRRLRQRLHPPLRSQRPLLGLVRRQEAPPYSFNTLHKLAIDTRFDPPRIIATDRANNRVVHLSLAGDFLGVVAKDLLLPAAVVLDGDKAVVGELSGRVSVLDKSGAVVERIGANTEQGVGTNKLPPARGVLAWCCRRTGWPSTRAATCSSRSSTCSAASIGSIVGSR